MLSKFLFPEVDGLGGIPKITFEVAGTCHTAGGGGCSEGIALTCGVNLGALAFAAASPKVFSALVILVMSSS